MPRVFVTRRLPVDARASLGGHDVEVFAPPRPPTREELERGARDAEALVPLLSDRIDAALLDACPRLRVVACYSVGTDNVDLEAAAARGVVVTNTPDVLTEATADVAWTLLLGVARRTREGERLARTGDLGAW
ncbi:MAG: D-glycerate dehydrogenase, partial [Myxococcales bacterium]|nr:D-glycerate dehydrogenase [Myxococcales bacterium]